MITGAAVSPCSVLLRRSGGASSAPAPTQSLVLENVSYTPPGDIVIAWSGPAGADPTAYLLVSDNPTATGGVVEAGGGLDGASWLLSGGDYAYAPSAVPAGDHFVHFVLKDGADLSNVISGSYDFPGVSFADPTDLGAKLVAWWDFMDNSVLWQNTGRTTAVTGTGQNISYVDDKSAQGNDLIGGKNPGYTGVPTRAAGGAAFVSGGTTYLSSDNAMTGMTSNMAVYVLLRSTGSANLQCLGGSVSASDVMGTMISSSSGSPADGAGSPVGQTHGVDVSPNTRGQQFLDWLSSGADIVVGMRDLDYSGSGWATEYAPMNYRNASITSDETVAHYVITTNDLTAQQKTNLLAWFDGEKI